MARALRPILKSTPRQLSDQDQTLVSFTTPTSSQAQLLQHHHHHHHHALHVHFPPTPHLARMEITHSPNTYDRAPIVVVPNDCAMPDRGCRSYGDGADRKLHSKSRKRLQCAVTTTTTTTTGTTSGTPGTGKGNNAVDHHHHQTMTMKHIESYFHPRAFEASSLYGSNNNTSKDKEDGEFEAIDECHLFATLSSSPSSPSPSPSASPVLTTASWTPPLSSPSLSSFSLASLVPSSDELPSFVPVPVVPVVPVHSQLHLQVHQSSQFSGDGEETVSPSSSSAASSSSNTTTPGTASLNALAVTLLPYLPSTTPSLPSLPSSLPASPKSKKKKGVAPSVGENNNGKRRQRRSSDLGCLTAYTRWSNPFSDPALDGCLGGF